MDHVIKYQDLHPQSHNQVIFLSFFLEISELYQIYIHSCGEIFFFKSSSNQDISTLNGASLIAENKSTTTKNRKWFRMNQCNSPKTKNPANKTSKTVFEWKQRILFIVHFFANTPFFASHKHTRKERLVKHKLLGL